MFHRRQASATMKKELRWPRSWEAKENGAPSAELRAPPAPWVLRPRHPGLQLPCERLYFKGYASEKQSVPAGVLITLGLVPFPKYHKEHVDAIGAPWSPERLGMTGICCGVGEHAYCSQAGMGNMLLQTSDASLDDKVAPYCIK